ncbi:MAG: hypothetical protein AVO33_00770 [delta proteobacterium ML8_F1]|nr:MAG: hypothetical protein AVO33_00770 [delta proteobacterium ML8_F1]
MKKALLVELLKSLPRREEVKVPEDRMIFDLLKEEGVTELMFNGYNNIFIERQGRIEAVEHLFESKAGYEAFMYRLFSRHNINLNEASPLANFNLGPDYRGSAVISSVTSGQTVLSVRTLKHRPLGLDALIKGGMFDRETGGFLLQLVKQKKNIFISGETSTGKTTLLNALLMSLPANERLVVIEDTREIHLPEEHNVVYLLARKGIYDAREVKISDLIKTSLRLRPDRLILGEIRREEVLQYIHVLNSGHKGSVCTGHSDSNQDMILRLTMLLLEMGIPKEAIAINLARSIDYFVHLSREGGIRRLKAIDGVFLESGQIHLEPVFSLGG